MLKFVNVHEKIVFCGLNHNLSDLILLLFLKKYFNNSCFLIEYNSHNFFLEKNKKIKTPNFIISQFLINRKQKVVFIDELADKSHKKYLQETNFVELFFLFILCPFLKNNRNFMKKKFPSFFENIFFLREKSMIEIVKRNLNLNYDYFVILVGKGHLEEIKKNLI